VDGAATNLGIALWCNVQLGGGTPNLSPAITLVTPADFTNANSSARAQVDPSTRDNTAAPMPHALTPLTGRNTEVGLLTDRWEQAQEGMGQVVLIVGEAGLVAPRPDDQADRTG
jgi:hypothetical protein